MLLTVVVIEETVYVHRGVLALISKEEGDEVRLNIVELIGKEGEFGMGLEGLVRGYLEQEAWVNLFIKGLLIKRESWGQLGHGG